MSGLTSAATLINQNKDGGVLGRFHHFLKLLIRRDWRFELGRNGRHRFKEAQKKTALDGVVHVFRQHPLAASAAAAFIAKIRATSWRDPLPLRHSECGFGVRGHVRALVRRDMSRRGKAMSCHRTPRQLPQLSIPK